VLLGLLRQKVSRKEKKDEYKISVEQVIDTGYSLDRELDVNNRIYSLVT
jgi:hypothetical protein